MKNRKWMALLISICLLFSSYNIGAAAGDGLDIVLPIPSAEESSEPSVTASPTPDATGLSSDEPTVAPEIEEPSEPSAPPAPAPDVSEPSSDGTTPTPAIDESPEPSATPDSPDATGATPTPAPADPTEEASAEAPLLEDTAQNPSGGEGEGSGVTIESTGDERANLSAGTMVGSSLTAASIFALTRNQVTELEAASLNQINGAQWTLSDTSVAEITDTSFSFVVTSSGAHYVYSVKVKGLRTGTATLSLRNGSGTVVQTATISVTTPVTGIELSDEVLYVGIGHRAQLTAAVSPADADDLTVNWSSSNESVVSVDDNGEVLAAAEGSATIYAESADGAFSASCVVYAGYLTEALQIEDGDIALHGADFSRKLTLSFQPANATYKEIRWTSSDPNVAVVDALGVVTARGNGHAAITVASMDTGASDSIDVEVSGFVSETGVALNAAGIVLTTEGKFTTAELTAIVAPGDASDRSVTWSVADGNIAHVDGDGVVTPVSIGTTVVTATTANGLYTASCSVRVIKGKYTLTFYSKPIPDGGGWSMDRLGQNTAYLYGDPVVFPEPHDGYRIEQWYRDYDYDTGALISPVPDGFMPEADMDFYAAKVPIHPESVKIQGVGEPWAIGNPSANVTIYSTFSPSAVANASYKYTSSDPSVAIPDMDAGWCIGGSNNLNGTIKLLKNGTVTISVVMQDGNLTDSITLSIAGLGSGRVNVHTISGQAKLATPVLKFADLLSNTSTTLRWEAVNGADGYEVFCEHVKYDWTSKIATVDRETTSYTYVKTSSVIESGGYPLIYSVRAYKNANGTTVYSGRSNSLAPVPRIAALTLSVPENTPMTGGGYDLRVGATLQIGTKVEPVGTSHVVSFKSSDSKVATVSSTGLVKGIKTGKATITVTAKDPSGLSNQVRAVQINVITPVSKVTLPTEMHLLTGKAKKLPATLSPSNATYKTVAWVSDNAAVAAVGADGTVAAKAVGTAKITATAHNGATASCLVRVTDPAKGIAIKTATSNLYVNYKEYLQLTAAVNPSTALQGVTWKSSNTKYVTVDANGRVYGKKVGKATVTATAKDGTGIPGSIVIQVITPVKGVKLPASEFVLRGHTKKLAPTLSPSDATYKTLTWSSDNEAVATVASDGKVTAKALGTATITAKTYNGLSASCLIRVTEPATSVSVTTATGNLYVNYKEYLQLTATVKPSTALEGVTWKSSNTKYVTVDANGRVYGKKVGRATVTATAKDGTGILGSIVIQVITPVKGVSLPETDSMFIGRAKKLTAALSPSSPTFKALTWTSSVESVAIVAADGTVTALALGETVITARAYNGLSDACILRVTQPVERISLAPANGFTLVYKGEKVALSAGITPLNAGNKALTWTSSNTKYATVDAQGVVTGKAAGSVKITATAKDGSKVHATISLTVAAPETSIKLSKASAILYHNTQTASLKQLGLAASASPSGAKYRGLTWTVVSGDAVTVDDKGVVTAVRQGTAVVRATTQRGYSAECTFEVRTLPTALTLKTTEKTLAYNTGYDLRADVEMDGSEPSLSWSTNNGKAATVSSSGVVKATGKAGKATITATTKNGLEATCVVTVAKG